MLARTIFEILLQVLYVSGAAERGELFLRHDPVDRYYFYLKLSKHPDLVDGIENRAAELETLKGNSKRLRRIITRTRAGGDPTCGLWRKVWEAKEIIFGYIRFIQP